MDKGRAKEIVKEIVDTCNIYDSCNKCPFFNILKYETNRCAFDDLSSEMVVQGENWYEWWKREGKYK